jgi:hypothetical protein
MKPQRFKHSTNTLQPSGAQYSENVSEVEPLPVWTDGEQCVSLWRPSFRERLSVLLFGRVWLALLSGRTQPPAYVVAAREYLQQEPGRENDV